MEIVCAQWNHDGSILAIGGIQVYDDKESNIVQFYTPWGNVIEALFDTILNIMFIYFKFKHLKTLKIPGTRIKGVSWEGNSLRIVIAIDSLIYFANMRPSHKVNSISV